MPVTSQQVRLSALAGLAAGGVLNPRQFGKALGQTTITGFLTGGAIKHRHVSKLGGPLRRSFMLGVGIGLLDQLGEIPPTLPEGLQ